MWLSHSATIILVPWNSTPATCDLMNLLTLLVRELLLVKDVYRTVLDLMLSRTGTTPYGQTTLLVPGILNKVYRVWCGPMVIHPSF